jgi:hypothetical protein
VHTEFLYESLKEIRELSRLRRGCDNNIEIDLREIGSCACELDSFVSG